MTLAIFPSLAYHVLLFFYQKGLMMESNDIQQLKNWFLLNQRDFPWRDNPSPYAVWVSEVMLQQTQASVVIPYFIRWMSVFPTIEALALASLDAVIKEWEGLGYYSRARNLHEGARYVLEHHQGNLPSNEEDLKNIKGLGPYTIGAILSFAFHRRKAAVDGNVMRVLARYYALPDDISQPKSVKKLQMLAQELLPQDEPWIISEALIELGATACSKKPKCLECPIRRGCRAFASDKSDCFPVKSAKTITQPLYRAVAVVKHEDSMLVRRGLKGEIMSDLYEFPYLELTKNEEPIANLQPFLEEKFKLKVCWEMSLQDVRHSFTRYRAHLFPQLFSAKKALPVMGYEWVTHDALKGLAFSSGHRRIYSQIMNVVSKG